MHALFVQVKLAGNNGLAKEVKADLTRTHFTMGNHKFDWQTDAMRTQVSFITRGLLRPPLFQPTNSAKKMT